MDPEQLPLLNGHRHSLGQPDININIRQHHYHHWCLLKLPLYLESLMWSTPHVLAGRAEGGGAMAAEDDCHGSGIRMVVTTAEAGTRIVVVM